MERAPKAKTVSNATRGIIQDDAATQAEVIALIKASG